MTTERPCRTGVDAAAHLAASAHTKQSIGLELELALLRDGRPATYEDGVEPMLQALLAESPGAKPHLEEGKLIGLSTPEGTHYTLEPGGQFEISTRPIATVGALQAELDAALGHLAALAEQQGLWVVNTSMAPSPPEASTWMPKGRYRIMREHFASLGEAGRLHQVMMQRTLSLQVSLDFRDADEAADMLRTALWASPVATAIFANTPLDGDSDRIRAQFEVNAIAPLMVTRELLPLMAEGTKIANTPLDGDRPSGFQSWRAESWRFVDPARCGIPFDLCQPEADLQTFADYALDVPMMFRILDGSYLPMDGASFRELWCRGEWPDGAPVTEADFWNHANGVFIDARFKPGLVELRATDAPAPAERMGVVAFWVGLLYDLRARAEATELLRVPEAVLRAAHAAVPRDALAAPYGDRTVGAVARDLLEIARGGLVRRIESGEETPEALDALAPVAQRVGAGRTAAESQLASWEGPWAGDLRKLQAAYRVLPRG